MSNVIPLKPQRIVVDEYFGGCRVCGESTGCLNVGARHWFYCEPHQQKWSVGWNLFSSWRDEDEGVWHENAERLASYTKVEPLPCTVSVEGGQP